MSNKPRYTVCFANDSAEYIVSWYKSYAWARKHVEANYGHYRFYRGCNQWAIERIMPEDQWSQTCVIAQSLNYSHKPRFRNRSEADKWTPDYVTDIGNMVEETKTV